MKSLRTPEDRLRDLPAWSFAPLGAGHFVQADAGEELVRIPLDFIARNPA